MVFQFRDRSRCGSEYYVPTRDIGAHVFVSHGGEEIAEVIHLYPTFAKIDSAEKGNVVRHGLLMPGGADRVQ